MAHELAAAVAVHDPATVAPTVRHPAPEWGWKESPDQVPEPSGEL